MLLNCCFYYCYYYDYYYYHYHYCYCYYCSCYCYQYYLNIQFIYTEYLHYFCMQNTLDRKVIRTVVNLNLVISGRHVLEGIQTYLYAFELGRAFAGCERAHMRC
jgi:hypothetical protein